MTVAALRLSVLPGWKNSCSEGVLPCLMQLLVLFEKVFAPDQYPVYVKFPKDKGKPRLLR